MVSFNRWITLTPFKEDFEKKFEEDLKRKAEKNLKDKTLRKQVKTEKAIIEAQLAADEGEDADIAAMMGFGSFGSSKKK